MTRMNRPWLLLSSPLWVGLLLLVGRTNAHTGNKFCACLPSTFVFTFDFSLGCSNDISSDDPGVAGFTCKVSGEGDTTPDDPVPVVVTDLQIIEIGQPTRSAIISTTTVTGGDFQNGDTYTFTSTADTSFPITDDAPKILQMLMTGANAAGEPVLNVWSIEFTNQCNVFPVLTPGMQAGWTVFTTLTNPITEVCPASPGPVPTASPVATPTTPVPTTATSAPTPAATSEAPSDVPSGTPTGSSVTGTPSTLPTIGGSTAAPVGGTTAAPTAAATATKAPTAGTKAPATAAPSAAATTPTPLVPTTSAPVPAPPASCADKEAAYLACASANFADGQKTECESCLARSFPSAGSNCTAFIPGICTALVNCTCEPCEAPLEDYTSCLLAQAGLTCGDLNCTLPTAAPAAPLVPSSTPAPSPATSPASDAPSGTPSSLATSDAPSDVPSSTPSSLLSGAPTPTAPAPAPTASNASSCDAINAAYVTCANTNFADGQKAECEGCLSASIPTTGTGCDFFNPFVCDAVYTTCNCAPCETQLEGYTECLFARLGLPCIFNCTGV